MAITNPIKKRIQALKGEYDTLRRGKDSCQKVLKGVPRATINYDLRDLKELEVIKPHGASVNIFYTLGF